MMSIVVVVVILLFLLLLLLLALLLAAACSFLPRPTNFPPGPRGLPIVGYLPYLSQYDAKYLHKSLMRLADKYGPVCGFYIGPTQPFVSVSGAVAVREALLNEDLAGRPSSAARKERTFGKRLGIIHNEGVEWMQQRRFALRHLRDLGFGRSSSEQLIQDEIADLAREMMTLSSSATAAAAATAGIVVVEFKGLFNLSLINILWAMTSGERFQRDDVRLKHLLETVESFIRSGHFVRANLPVPAWLLRKVPLVRRFVGLRNDLFTPLQDFIRESIERHLDDRLASSSSSPSSSSLDAEPRDFIDLYLAEMLKPNNNSQTAAAPSPPSGSDTTSFHKEQLIGVIIDLFIAGAETTSNSIGFAILYMLHHPEVQQRVQEELDQVCGSSLPSLSHRSKLTYTEAVLMEVQRISDIVPLAVAHQATKETRLQGYTIPKGCIVSVNLHSLHHDPIYWKDPDLFRPERHLLEVIDGDDDGEDKTTTNLHRRRQQQRLKRSTDHHFLPFSAGKRMCLGEPLARNTYYLFVTTLLKQFHFELLTAADDDGDDDESTSSSRRLPSLEPVNGLAMGYMPFRAVVKPRH